MNETKGEDVLGSKRLCFQLRRQFAPLCIRIGCTGGRPAVVPRVAIRETRPITAPTNTHVVPNENVHKRIKKHTVSTWAL